MSQFGTFQWNTMMWDGGNTNAPVYATDLVVFDSFSLADNSNTFVQRIEDSEPSRELIDFKVPRGDGMGVIADYYRQKDILVTGVVVRDTAAHLDAYLDTVRQNLRKREAYLDITRNGVVRRYVATLTNGDQLFGKREGWNITVCPFEAKFTCMSPFATDRDYSSVSQALTSSPTTLVAVDAGTVKAQPVITLVFDAASSVTAVDIQNSSTSEEIQYNGACAAGDVLVFDSEAKSVKKNGTAVDFLGSFPSLDVGSNNVKFTITATSFNAYTTVKWKNTYL